MSYSIIKKALTLTWSLHSQSYVSGFNGAMGMKMKSCTVEGLEAGSMELVLNEIGSEWG